MYFVILFVIKGFYHLAINGGPLQVVQLVGLHFLPCLLGIKVLEREDRGRDRL